jgi:type I restriction enzyme S subunit
MNKAQTMEKTKETKAYKYKPSGIEWLGDIPEHWEVKSGLSAFTNKKIKNTGLKEETVLSLSYGKIVIKPKEKLHGLVPESFETYQLVDIGNIIIRVMDLQNDKVSLRVGLAKDKGIITSAYLCLQVTEQIIYQYGFYLLHAYDLMKIFYGMGSGLRQNLDYRDIKRMPVLIPPIEEQNQIAQYLDYKTKQINRFIKNKQKLIKLLKEQKQNIINQAVIKGTNKNVSFKPSGIEWLGDIPVHWEMRKVKFIFQLVNEQTFVKNNDEVYIALEHVESWTGRINIPKEEAYFESQVKRFQVNDILFMKLRPYLAKIAKPSFQGVCSGEMLVLRNKIEDLAWGNFLEVLLRSKSFIELINSSTYGAKMPRAEWNFIGNAYIPLPPPEEQKAIVEYIEKETAIIDKAIERTEREIELIKEYKTTLISEVVTGKKLSGKLTEEQLKWLEESEENNEPENDELEENAEAIEEEIE